MATNYGEQRGGEHEWSAGDARTPEQIAEAERLAGNFSLEGDEGAESRIEAGRYNQDKENEIINKINAPVDPLQAAREEQIEKAQNSRDMVKTRLDMFIALNDAAEIQKYTEMLAIADERLRKLSS